MGRKFRSYTLLVICVELVLEVRWIFLSSLYIASLLTQFSLLVHHDTICKNAKEIVAVDHEALCDNEFSLIMA